MPEPVYSLCPEVLVDAKTAVMRWHCWWFSSDFDLLHPDFLFHQEEWLLKHATLLSGLSVVWTEELPFE